MSVDIADYSPLAKFSSGTFGVLERFAEGEPDSNVQEAAVPVTLRHVEVDLTTRSLGWAAGEVATLRSVEDAEVRAWYARLQRLASGRRSSAQVQDIVCWEQEGRQAVQACASW